MAVIRLANIYAKSYIEKEFNLMRIIHNKKATSYRPLFAWGPILLNGCRPVKLASQPAIHRDYIKVCIYVV